MNWMQLGGDFAQCPKQWQNFVDETSAEHPDLWDGTINDNKESLQQCNQILNAKLATFNATRIKQENGYPLVIFSDEKTYAWFMLRYS